MHPPSRRARTGRRTVLRRPGRGGHLVGQRVRRPARTGPRRAQRGMGRSAGHRLGRPDPELQVRRGHRQHRLPLHLAPAQGPDLELRRPAEHDPRRRTVAGTLERHRHPPSAGREPDLRPARRRPTARLGPRAQRHERAGARLPLPLRAGRPAGRQRTDAHRPRRRRCAAPVRQHPRCPAPGRAVQFDQGAAEPDHAAQGRPRRGRRSPGRPARGGHHAAARDGAHRRRFRAHPDQRDQEDGDR